MAVRYIPCPHIAITEDSSLPSWAWRIPLAEYVQLALCPECKKVLTGALLREMMVEAIAKGVRLKDYGNG